MARQDILSDVLREYIVTVKTEFGTSNVRLRAFDEENATVTVSAALVEKHPNLGFEVSKVKLVVPRPAPEPEK